MNICLVDERHDGSLCLLAQRFGLTHDAQHPLALVQTAQWLELRQQPVAKPDRLAQKQSALVVDFCQGSLAWRQQFGGGRSEALVRAAGVKGNYLPTVLDATAGLGRDAFILAAAGCRVHMLERNPVIAALLEDGLQRGYQHPHIGSWLRERLTLQFCDSHAVLPEDYPPVSAITPFSQAALPVMPQVVYLDPMFPHRRKSALVKQPMRLLQQLAGDDADASTLLAPARLLATKRVVVKRPAQAAPLANTPAQGAVHTKNHRFDIYAPLQPPHELVKGHEG